MEIKGLKKCLLRGVQKYIIRMCSFKPGQKEILSRDFHKQKQVTDILRINVRKVMLSDRVSCSHGKNWRYIVSYQEGDEKIIAVFYQDSENRF